MDIIRPLQYLRRFAESDYEIILMNCVGDQRSGKTNLAKKLVAELYRSGKFDWCRYFKRPTVEDAIGVLAQPANGNIIIVLDDISFLYKGSGGIIDEFQNALATIFHTIGDANPDITKIALLTIEHYYKSINPFMRKIADLNFFTSIDYEDVERYHKMFSVRRKMLQMEMQFNGEIKIGNTEKWFQNYYNRDTVYWRERYGEKWFKMIRPVIVTFKSAPPFLWADVPKIYYEFAENGVDTQIGLMMDKDKKIPQPLEQMQERGTNGDALVSPQLPRDLLQSIQSIETASDSVPYSDTES